MIQLTDPWVHRKRQACRGCGGSALSRFLSLGPTPLANSFLRSPGEFAGEASFPLDVYLCETCSLVQLLDVINPEVLFRNYIYVTGTSDTIAAHNRELARTAVERMRLGGGDLVVEVASNDGSLLRCFRDHGVRTLGVEPALNVAEIARSTGIETVTEFFGADVAPRLRQDYGPAAIVIGNNVLAHVDDSQGFLRGCRDLLRAGGQVIIEAPYLGDLLDRLEYDTIYHEHLCYFSVTALMHLCAAVGLVVVQMDHVPVHGGSLRMYAGRREDFGTHAPAVVAWSAREQHDGLTAFSRYERLAAAVEANRRANVGLLRDLKGQGKTVAGYGAPAKGNTLLNYCGIGTDLLPYTVDKSPLKVGLWTPGMHIPVLPVAALLERQPDYVFILAWNFSDEIMRQQQEYRRRGGQFIVPIPEPRVV